MRTVYIYDDSRGNASPEARLCRRVVLMRLTLTSKETAQQDSNPTCFKRNLRAGVQMGEMMRLHRLVEWAKMVQ